MRMITYLIGSLLVAGALAYAAIILLDLPPVWVGIAVVVILGLGIMGAARTSASYRSTTTTTSPSAAPPANQVTVTKEEL